MNDKPPQNGKPAGGSVPAHVQNALHEAAMAAAMRAQRREQLAGIVLNGICAGLYTRSDLPNNWAERAVGDAVKLADHLMAELAKPPEAPAAPPPTANSG